MTVEVDVRDKFDEDYSSDGESVVSPAPVEATLPAGSFSPVPSFVHQDRLLSDIRSMEQAGTAYTASGVLDWDRLLSEVDTSDVYYIAEGSESSPVKFGQLFPDPPTSTTAAAAALSPEPSPRKRKRRSAASTRRKKKTKRTLK